VLDIAETAVFAACVGGWPTPLRPGDQVIAIDGVTPMDAIARQPQAPPGWLEGGTARYTIKRGDATLDLDVPLRQMGWDGILRAFGYGLAPDAWSTFALFGAIGIFALAPRDRARRDRFGAPNDRNAAGGR